MIKLILPFFLLFTTLSNAQIINGGFEIWNGIYANTYSSELNNQFGVPNPVGGTIYGWSANAYYGISRTTDGYSGNYALIIHNWYAYAYQSVFYNDTCSIKPQFVQGIYKYITGSTNGLSHGSAKVTLTHFNGIINDTVATGSYSFDSSSFYRPFQIPLNYISTVDPDSIHIKIVNGNTQCYPTVICNLLYLDNLQLSNSPLSFENNVSKELVMIYPNPVNTELYIQNNSLKSFQFKLYNALGENLVDKIIDDKTSTINLSSIPKGMYFYKITLDSNKVTCGKIIKQ